MAKQSNSYHEWKDDSDSAWVNYVLFALIFVIVLGIGAAVYLNQDVLLGNEDDSTNPTVDADVAELDENADVAKNADEAVDSADTEDDDVSDTASNASTADDTADTDLLSDDTADDVGNTADFTAEEDADTDAVENDAANDEEADAAEESDDDSDFAPSGNVRLIENVPMRDILSIYAYPNPSIKLFSVLENFSPHAAGRYEEWVYVYYFYSEVVMDEDGETVLNRHNDLRDGWVARGRLQLTDAQFNSLRVLNPENLPALPNIEYTEETALPFLGLREVAAEEDVTVEESEQDQTEEQSTE